MELRELAEQVLYGTTLEEKLLISPKSVVDSQAESLITLPDAPGRPKELLISEKGVKADFPGVNKMDDRGERGKMLHFLANHELLATELMALVLLKFPNAPKEFRMGVFETLKEEQAHTLMYMRRMKECGVEFGQLPVNDYFWRMVAPMECPMDFVSSLSLVFEQANLDYSKHYAELFREVGDTGTAAVLDKIYHDEIGHVGHGLKWFRIWKEQGLTDWQAFKKQLTFPLTTARAKGMAPYNAEGRKEAGLNEQWVQDLEVVEQSRGRTPIIHWFNPNAELVVAANENGVHFQPKKSHRALEDDLAILPMTWARKDDVVLMNDLPSRKHLVRLKEWGFPMPELLDVENDQSLNDRKIGGLLPWAWSPDASKLLEKYKPLIPSAVKKGWREPFSSRLFSKRLGLDLAVLLGETIGKWCPDYSSVKDAVFKRGGSVDTGDSTLLKAPYSSAGRGHKKVSTEEWDERIENWVKRVIREQGGVVAEPWLERVLDFSAQYEINPEGDVKLVGMTRVLNDPAGRYLGTFVHSKWTSGLDVDLNEFLFRNERVMELYKTKMPAALKELLDGEGFVGNLSVDAMVHRDRNGDLQLRKVVEVNARMTMGRVALELLKKTSVGKAGLFRILRKRELGNVEQWLENVGSNNNKSDAGMLSEGIYPLNDPVTAKEFVAVWEVAPTFSDFTNLYT